MGRDGESKILFPTMKSLDGVNKKNDVNNTASEAPEKNVKTESEKIDFSNVKIEPIFEKMVDFDTFAKRREHITYQDDMPLSQSIFQASKRFSKLPMISR